MIDLSKKMNDDRREEFCRELQRMSRKIGFKVSSRGWCYLMEQARMINKDQFNKVEEVINDCRKRGFLPVDFVAEEDSRAFSGVEEPSEGTIKDVLKQRCEWVLKGHWHYTPDWWEGEEYYIQMLVEKIDLKTLFTQVTEQYHIPIANSKGWSSILQRADYARRFKEAESKGLQCVLLYCGDHDPDGLRISETIRTNLQQLSEIYWEDGEQGYDPSDLQIMRFGLNYEFIEANNYTWINNLITGSGNNLADPRHKNHSLPYVKDYLRNYGERKCEANAIVTTPEAARRLVREEIESIVGDARSRFKARRAEVKTRYDELLEESGLMDALQTVIDSDDEED